MPSLDTFDLRTLPDAFYEDPYPWYQLLRAQSPVHRLPDGGWLLSRHADLMQVYRDPVLFSSDKTLEFRPRLGDGPTYEHHTSSLVFNDPPLHTRVRRILMGALAPRAIAAMREGLEQRVASLLDRLGAQPDVDLVGDYAAQLPVEVIGDLLGVPHAERAPLRGWSLAILGALEPAISDAQRLAADQSVMDFCTYLRGLIASRRAAPGDPDRDVLTRLILGEKDGSMLSETELLHNCIFILNAGHETTSNLIGNGLMLLHQWPDQRERLIGDPLLIGPAIEEILRFESPNQLGNRRTTAATRIDGQPLQQGNSITLLIGAANRDPAVFADPERFDISRTPNRHLAFAIGAHQCAGLALARLEGAIAIGQFVARYPRFAVGAGTKRSRRARFRGWERLPARLEA